MVTDEDVAALFADDLDMVIRDLEGYASQFGMGRPIRQTSAEMRRPLEAIIVRLKALYAARDTVTIPPSIYQDAQGHPVAVAGGVLPLAGAIRAGLVKVVTLGEPLP